MPQHTLLIVRGLPGSGKSTVAKQWATDNHAYHVEADMYFVDKSGHYNFDPKKLSGAHQWCVSQVEKHLKRGESIAVSNTFVQAWEWRPYLGLAKKYKAVVKLVECEGNFGSIHGVPQETIENMKTKWQRFELAGGLKDIDFERV